LQCQKKKGGVEGGKGAGLLVVDESKKQERGKLLGRGRGRKRGEVPLYHPIHIEGQEKKGGRLEGNGCYSHLNSPSDLRKKD